MHSVCFSITYLHDRLVVSQCHSAAFLILKSYAPDRLALGDKLSDQVAGLQVPDFNTAVAATTDYSRVVELQASNAIVMGRESVDGRHLLERPDPDTTVGPASDQGVPPHLQLANQRCVSLKNRQALAVFSRQRTVPGSHG